MSKRKFEINDRVQAGSGKFGTIRFMGETKFAPGEWIGVELETPDGKNDGSVAGVSYFTCEPLYGLFVKAAQCKHAEENKSKLETMKEKKKAAAAPVTEAPASTPSKIPHLAHSSSSGSAELPPVPILTAPDTSRPSPREASLEKQVAQHEEALAQANKKITELTSHANESQHTIEQLQTQLAQHEADKATMQATIATLESQLQEVQSLQMQTSQQKSTLEAEKNELAAQLTALSANNDAASLIAVELATANASIESLKQQLAQYEQSSSAHAISEATLRNEISNLIAEKETLTAKLADVSSKLDTVNARNVELQQIETEFNQNKTENASLLSQLSLLTSQKDALSTQLSDLQASLANSADTSSIYEQQLAEMRKSTEELSKLQQQVIVLETTVTKHQEESRSNDATIDALQKELQHLGEKEKGLQQELTDVQKNLSAATGTVSAYEEQLQELQKSTDATIAALHAQIAVLTDDMANKQAEVDDLSTKAAELRVQNEEATTQISKLQDDIIALETSKYNQPFSSNLIFYRQSANHEIASLQQRLRDIQDDASSTAATVDEARAAHITSLETQISSLKADLSSMTEKCDASSVANNETISSLEQQLEQAQQQQAAAVTSLKKENSALQAKIDELTSKLNEATEKAAEMLKITSEISTLKVAQREDAARIQSLQQQLTAATANASAAGRVTELESQVSELMDTVEIMTLDAEQKALEYEAMEERLRQLEKAMSATNVAPAAGATKSDSGEVAKLTDALLKLQQIHVSDTAAIASLKEQLEQMSVDAELALALQDENEKLKVKVEELSEMVDDSANLSSLMEALSHQNQELVTKNTNLNTLVNELELTVEVNEQLDASQRLEIDTLRKENDSLSVKLRNANQSTATLQGSIAELKGNIEKLRHLLGESKAENASLLQQLTTLQAELSSTATSKHTATVASTSVAEYQQQLQQLQTQLFMAQTDYHVYYTYYNKVKPVVEGVGTDVAHVELCGYLSACIATSVLYAHAVAEVALATGCHRLAGLSKERKLKYEKMEQKEVAIVASYGCDVIAAAKLLVLLAKYLTVGTVDTSSNVVYLLHQYRSLLLEKLNRLGKETKRASDIENIAAKLSKAVSALNIDESVELPSMLPTNEQLDLYVIAYSATLLRCSTSSDDVKVAVDALEVAAYQRLQYSVPVADDMVLSIQQLQHSELSIDELYRLTHLLADATGAVVEFPAAQSYFAWISPAPLPIPELSNPETQQQLSNLQQQLTQKQKDIATLISRVKELESLHAAASTASTAPVTPQSRSLESLQEENRVLLEAIDILETKMAKMQVATPVTTQQTQQNVTVLDVDIAVAYEMITNLKKLAVSRVASLEPLPVMQSRPIDDIVEAQRLYRDVRLQRASTRIPTLTANTATTHARQRVQEAQKLDSLMLAVEKCTARINTRQ